MAQAKLLKAEKIASMIKAIVGQKAQLEAAIQVAAIQCIGQSIVHGNITPARDLYTAVRGGIRRDTLLKFFEVYGNMAHSKITKEIEFVRTHAKEAWTTDYVKRLEAMPWFEAKKEAPASSIYDCEDVLSKLFGRMKRAVGDKGVTVKHVEIFDACYAAYCGAVADLAVMEAKVDPKLVEAGEKADEMAQRRQEAQTPASSEKLAELADHFGKAEVKAA